MNAIISNNIQINKPANPLGRTLFRLPAIVCYLVYAFAFSLSFEFWGALNVGSFTITKVVGLLLFGTILLYARRILVSPSRSALALLIIWVWIAVTSTLNADSNAELYEVFSGSIFTLLQCFVLYYIAQCIFRDQSTALNVLISFACGCVIIAMLTLLGFGLEIAGTEGGIDRETMFGANPNTFAFLEVLGIVIIVGIVVENPCAFGKWRFLALATVPLLLKASFMTGSRGALVSLALGLTPFFFTRNTARLRVLIWLLLIGCGLLITFYVKNSDILMERMERTIEKGNTAGRLELWQVAVERIAEKPFSGWGFTGMIRCFNEVSDVSDPHNVFLTMFLLTGIFGGIFFLMLAARWIFQALAARQTVWGCIPLALAVVVLSLFFKGGGAYSLKVAWLMLACVAAMGDRRYSMIDWDRKPFVKATGEPEIMKRDKTF